MQRAHRFSPVSALPSAGRPPSFGVLAGAGPGGFRSAGAGRIGIAGAAPVVRVGARAANSSASKSNVSGSPGRSTPRTRRANCSRVLPRAARCSWTRPEKSGSLFCVCVWAERKGARGSAMENPVEDDTRSSHREMTRSMAVIARSEKTGRQLPSCTAP